MPPRGLTVDPPTQSVRGPSGEISRSAARPPLRARYASASPCRPGIRLALCYALPTLWPRPRNERTNVMRYAAADSRRTLRRAMPCHATQRSAASTRRARTGLCLRFIDPNGRRGRGRRCAGWLAVPFPAPRSRRLCLCLCSHPCGHGTDASMAGIRYPALRATGWTSARYMFYQPVSSARSAASCRRQYLLLVGRATLPVRPAAMQLTHHAGRAGFVYPVSYLQR